MKLPSDWSEFIALLCAHRVRFLIVGAHALAAHGRPRATQDIDFWVEPPALAGAVEEFSTPERMATLGVPPLRIDVMTSIDGVSSSEAWEGRLQAKFGQHHVGFLGREAFIKNKRASGRPKGLADIALLSEADT